jgi:hypothetical protein
MKRCFVVLAMVFLPAVVAAQPGYCCVSGVDPATGHWTDVQLILKQIENEDHSRFRFSINRPKGCIITRPCRNEPVARRFADAVIFNDVQYMKAAGSIQNTFGKLSPTGGGLFLLAKDVDLRDVDWDKVKPGKNGEDKGKDSVKGDKKGDGDDEDDEKGDDQKDEKDDKGEQDGGSGGWDRMWDSPKLG